MSEFDRLKEQLVYLRFWIGIMVATEIALMGWLISTPIGANQTLWLVHSVLPFSGRASFSYIGNRAASIK